MGQGLNVVVFEEPLQMAQFPLSNVDTDTHFESGIAEGGKGVISQKTNPSCPVLRSVSREPLHWNEAKMRPYI